MTRRDRLSSSPKIFLDYSRQAGIRVWLIVSGVANRLRGRPPVGEWVGSKWNRIRGDVSASSGRASRSKAGAAPRALRLVAEDTANGTRYVFLTAFWKGEIHAQGIEYVDSGGEHAAIL